MSALRMNDIQHKIEATLARVGYTYDSLTIYDKWSRGREDTVGFAKQIIRAHVDTLANRLIWEMIGPPNGSVSILQLGHQVSWFTDGYRGRGTAAI